MEYEDSRKAGKKGEKPAKKNKEKHQYLSERHFSRREISKSSKNAFPKVSISMVAKDSPLLTSSGFGMEKAEQKRGGYGGATPGVIVRWLLSYVFSLLAFYMFIVIINCFGRNFPHSDCRTVA